MSKTLGILGATGKTGRWALKGALARGWSVRLLVRSPGKVEGLLRELLPDSSAEHVKGMLESRVTLVKGSGFGQAELLQVIRGADAVVSFVGMVKRDEAVVTPAAQAVIDAMEQLGAHAPKKFLCMSSIGFNDGKQHGFKAWGYLMMTATKCIPGLKESFKDMAQAETLIMDARASNPNLDLIIVRCTILEESKKILCDYADPDKMYNIIKAGDSGQFSFCIDRQYVAQAFLDLSEDSSAVDNQNVSCFAKKK